MCIYYYIYSKINRKDACKFNELSKIFLALLENNDAGKSVVGHSKCNPLRLNNKLFYKAKTLKLNKKCYYLYTKY